MPHDWEQRLHPFQVTPQVTPVVTEAVQPVHTSVVTQEETTEVEGQTTNLDTDDPNEGEFQDQSFDPHDDCIYDQAIDADMPLTSLMQEIYR